MNLDSEAKLVFSRGTPYVLIEGKIHPLSLIEVLQAVELLQRSLDSSSFVEASCRGEWKPNKPEIIFSSGPTQELIYMDLPEDTEKVYLRVDMSYAALPLVLGVPLRVVLPPLNQPFEVAITRKQSADQLPADN